MGTALIAMLTIGFVSFVYLVSDLTSSSQQKQVKMTKIPAKKSIIKHKAPKHKTLSLITK
jgi:hypothetical protein